VAIVRRLAGSFWIRLLVSLALLAVVATQIDFHALRGRLGAGSWGWLAGAVAVLFASFAVGAVRWHVYIGAAGMASSRRQALRAYLIGMFTTNFLPTQIGGDVTRAWVASGQGTRVRSLTTVVVDRATALGCLILVGWIAVLASPAGVPGQLEAALGAAAGAYALACVLCVLVFRRAGLGVVPDRARPAAREIRATLIACLTRPVIARTVAIGLAFQGLVCLGAWMVGRAIPLDVPFAVLAAVLAPVMILTALPVSIAGFGVREGSLVVLLGYAGVSATDATLFSLLSAAVFALASLPGALALLVGRRTVVPSSLPS
jgi:uncharacterized membrane protein YbhN (UPF0104 family)